MKPVLFALFCTLPAWAAASTIPEYNTWYKRNGVMTGLTQTSSSEPVLVSIAHAGTMAANMVISYVTDSPCDERQKTADLHINHRVAQAGFSCLRASDQFSIYHYSLNQHEQINYLHEQLMQGFTVMLQKDIRVWVANYSQPRYGVSPRLW